MRHTDKNCVGWYFSQYTYKAINTFPGIQIICITEI